MRKLRNTPASYVQYQYRAYPTETIWHRWHARVQGKPSRPIWYWNRGKSFFYQIQVWRNTIYHIWKRNCALFRIRSWGDYIYYSVTFQVSADDVKKVPKLRSHSKGLQKNKLSMQKMFQRRLWTERLYSRNEQMPPLLRWTLSWIQRLPETTRWTKNPWNNWERKSHISKSEANCNRKIHQPHTWKHSDVNLSSSVWCNPPKKCQTKNKPMVSKKSIQHHIGKMTRKCRGKPGDPDTLIVEVSSTDSPVS